MMTLPQADITDLDYETLMLDNTRLNVRSKAQDLIEGGYIDQALRDEIIAHNQTLAFPLSADDLQPILDQYAPLPTTAPQEETPNNTTLYRQALADKDKRKLYYLASHLATLKQSNRIQFEWTMQEIEATFGKDIKMHNLRATITAEERKQKLAETQGKPSVADIAYQWTSQYRDTWAWDEACEKWRTFGNGDYWEEQADKATYLDQHAVAALQDAEIPVNSVGALNLFQRVAASHCKRPFVPIEGKVNFADITLDLATMKTQRHDRDDHFTYCLPYCYDLYGKHPQITRYLEDTIPDAHARQAFMAHLGLALMGDTYMHNFILFIGPTRSGKSTLLALGNAVCGDGNAWSFAGASLFSRELEGKRSRSKWNKRRMVCIDELPAEALRDEETLKTMTGHGGMEERSIGKDENTDNRWRPKLMMSTNDTPHYKDTSGAIKQRALIIECPNGPRPDDQQDKMLFPKKLLPEVGAFAATCLRMGKLALERGYYPRSQEMAALLDRIASEGNPLKAFIDDQCVLSPDAKVTAAQLHTNYKEYCLEAGNHAIARNKLLSVLRDMHIGVTSGWMRDDNNKPARAFHGIRLRVDHDPDPLQRTYEATPLLESVYGSVYVVNDTSTANFSIVDALDPHDKPLHTPLSTMSTIDCQKNTIENISHCPQETPVYRVGDELPKQSLTSLTATLDPHDKPLQGVYDTQKQSLQSVDVSLTTLTPCNEPLDPLPLLPELIERYPQEVYEWHEARGEKIEKVWCYHNPKHNNATYLPWFNENTGLWENLCSRCYPGLRSSNGKYCEAP